jgi:hypothetical protein
MAQLVKTVNGLAIASVKTLNGLAIASVKTINGLDNTVAAAGTPVITAQTVGTLRSNGGNYYVGFTFTVGSSSITVTELGRWCTTGDSNTHDMVLKVQSTGDTVTNGTATVNMSGATANQYKYVTLATPCVLAANTRYACLSKEITGQDQFGDNNTAITVTAAVGTPQWAYWITSGAVSQGGSDASYVPVNFKYY